MPVRARMWSFTINNPTDADHKEMDTLMDMPSVHRLIGGREKGKEGTPHIQGCVRFETVKSMLQVKALLSRAHLEKSGGTWKQNATYCSKEGDVKWRKNEKGGQGERTDWQDGITAIQGGAGFTEICMDFPAIGRCPRMFNMIREETAAKNAPKWRDVKVTILWGMTGTGKTRKAVDHDSVYMWHASDPWWCGYDGETRLVIDEFRDSQCKCSKLLRILDGYPLKLQVKGSHTYAKWTEVIITSNVDPDEWYSGVDPATRDALFRRVDDKIYMV